MTTTLQHGDIIEMDVTLGSWPDDEGIDIGGQTRHVRARIEAVNPQDGGEFNSVDAFDLTTGRRLCSLWTRIDANKFPGANVRVLPAAPVAPAVMDFIASARAVVASLTDSADGTQMHARAVAGKPLVVHVHGWDRTAWGGTGCCAVSLRVAGQYLDRALVGLPSTAEAEAFAADVRAALMAA